MTIDDRSDGGIGGGDSPSGDWEAMARFLAEESSPEDRAAMRQLLDESPDDAALVAAMQRALDRLPASSYAGDIDVDAAFRRVAARREGPTTPLTVSRGVAPSPVPVRAVRGAAGRRAESRRWRPFVPPAIAAAAVLALGFAVWRGGSGEGAAPTPAAVAETPQTLRTGVGVRDSIRLTDGSLVVLAPMSELSFIARAEGDGGERVATLRGEGYFEVVHDEARPFIVRAGDALIRDIGTAFSVHGSDDREVTVVVTEGVVELEGSEPAAQQTGAQQKGAQQGMKETTTRAAATPALRLERGDIGVRHADGRTTLRRGAATGDEIAWRRGALVFRDAPFREVADRVRRWYGVELRAADASIAARHVTADLTGEKIERVLQLLSLSLGAELERQGTLAVLRDAARREGGGSRR